MFLPLIKIVFLHHDLSLLLNFIHPLLRWCLDQDQPQLRHQITSGDGWSTTPDHIDGCSCCASVGVECDDHLSHDFERLISVVSKLIMLRIRLLQSNISSSQGTFQFSYHKHRNRRSAIDPCLCCVPVNFQCWFSSRDF